MMVQYREGPARPVPRAFRVGIAVRGRWFGPGYPRGRWVITPDRMILSAAGPLGGIPTVWVFRDEVEQVLFSRRWSITIVTFLDRDRILEGVELQMPQGADRARRHLLAFGYPVLAYDRWLGSSHPRRQEGWQEPPQQA